MLFVDAPAVVANLAEESHGTDPMGHLEQDGASFFMPATFVWKPRFL